MKTLLAATLLSLTMGSVALANPDQPPRGKPNQCMQKSGAGHHGAMGMKPPFLRGIALSDTQKDKVFALTHAEVPKMRDRMKAMRSLKEEMRTLVESNQFSNAKANNIANQIAQLKKESVLAKANQHHNILNILTAEQREQVLKNKEKFKKRHAKSRQGGFKNRHTRAVI